MRLTYIMLCIAAFCVACDPLANPRHGDITFSSDTVFFDTVFTTMGSATLEVRAINKSDRPLAIDRIWLAGGENSPFKINIDGNPDGNASDKIIAAGDSIFIFIEVKIDPVNSDLPVSVTDSVMFSSGNNLSRVFLQAWGQDIILLKNAATGNATWSGTKPYVIYGNFSVDTLKSLTIMPGTKIYFHNKASMTVSGTLNVSGSTEEPVLFATDMTYDDYSDVPGQWKGITFNSCSRSNKITGAVIRNAGIALNIQGKALTDMPDLELYNVSVLHNSVSSLNSVAAYIKAANCVFGHTGFSTIHLSEGGEADLVHCTVAERWGYTFRSVPAVYIEKGAEAGLPAVTVKNTVIAGDRTNEIEIETTPAELPGKIYFDSSYVQVDTLHASWWNHTGFKGVLTGNKPGFIDWNKYDFRPDTLSALQDRAGRNAARPYPADIRNKPRPAFNGPDIGAYERQPGEKSQ